MDDTSCTESFNIRIISLSMHKILKPIFIDNSNSEINEGKTSKILNVDYNIVN